MSAEVKFAEICELTHSWLASFQVSITVVLGALHGLPYGICEGWRFLKMIFARLVQLENAEDPMLVTLLPIITLVSSLQPSNAWPLMLVTLSGIVMLVRLLQ